MDSQGTCENLNKCFPDTHLADATLQHVYITGGSQGLGLELAKLVAQKGAHVSIVARTQSKLDSALKELEVRV